MISASGLVVVRGGTRILDGVDFAAAAGEITCILGPNGAGKSTLLGALTGLLPIEAGAVSVQDTPLTTMTARERARRLAYVPQRTGLRSALHVEAVVSHGRYAHTGGLGRPGPADLEAIEDAMRETDILQLRGRRFDRLSEGERRRVLIARALATRAEVLLLDEPTAALDVRHTLELHALLGRLAERGRCVVVVLHGLDAARKHAQRAVLLCLGRVVAAGPAGEVVSTEHVRDVYGVELVEGDSLGFRLEPAGAS